MEDRDRVLTDDLALEVLSVVADIPEGRVATYGQIARLIGRQPSTVSRVEFRPNGCVDMRRYQWDA